MSSDFQLEEAGLMLRAKQKQFKPCWAVRNMRNSPGAAQVCNLSIMARSPSHRGPGVK